jgi:hypothetical protein
MMKSQNLMMSVESVGEDVGLELGDQFVANFQTTFPNEAPGFLIGKKIITQILNQPGCEGLKVYNAINEFGQKTLVYVGIDNKGGNILEITTVSNGGALGKSKAIVGDRSRPPILKPDLPSRPNTSISSDDWEWTID